jgi:hypothetical protein
MNVSLTEEEWTRLLNCASFAPYREVQPLIQKVMEQLLRLNEATLIGRRAA